jgi:hypothetical protein
LDLQQKSFFLKRLPLRLIKKKELNRAKSDTTGAKAHTTPPNKTRRSYSKAGEKDAVSAMGGANTGRSNEEDNPLEELPHDAHRPHDTRPRSSQTTIF